ncbi:hypothetical protein A3D88_00810 [Candidatus Peribacteria bacterium RIFCSPHIGHO2_02_FULL_52_16]|nr:MAG: hypothetical protein A2706_00880 [Candidatus Peribacteria bacterium RIFCSPHIGHO2_01_FULL_51_35]OGJ61210.1 MAG: hypothetical protein A3D88_00810 [Candidatus Peribacteria bacterium RIFCSPHIGHO2_02_FULL_52_16]
MSSPGHKGGQSSHEIARNLAYVERLKDELIREHGETLVEMYRTMKRERMAEILLPKVKINSAKSALREALNELMTYEERMQIARQRWADVRGKHGHTFTPAERARGNKNKVVSKEHMKHMIESRGDAIWKPTEETLLVAMMKAGDDLQSIADAVSKVAGNTRSISACRDRWLKTKLISNKMRKKVTQARFVAAGRGFTAEERARGHTFDDEDRKRAKEVLGVVIWSPEEDKALIELRDSRKKFREIAEILTQRFGIKRTTAGCISRFYTSLKMGTRKRKRKSAEE